MTERFFHHPWLELALRWMLGLTFVYSGMQKVVAPVQFAGILHGYALFPASSINLIAIVLPFVELFAGAALLLGIYPRAAALIVQGLLVVFIGAISTNLIRGVTFDCGCFSVGGGHIADAGQLLFRDILYLLAGLYIFFFPNRRKGCLRATDDVSELPGAVH